MPQVKTAEGVIDCPELNTIGPRTKYWASVIRDVIRTEEMYMVMAAALNEAYDAGRIEAVKELMFNLGRRSEVIDAEFAVVEGSGKVLEQGTAGPEPEEPAGNDQVSGPIEPEPAAVELSGSVPESTERERSDAEKVEESPWHVNS